MTKNLFNKFIWFLIDPDINNQDFKEFTKWLKEGGLDTSISLANKVRQEIDNIDLKPSLINKKYVKKNVGLIGLSNKERKIVREVPVLSTKTYDDKVFKEVYRLLIKESKLKKTDALKSIADNIGYNNHIPEGISFKEGINRFIDFAGESKILHIAQSMRNKLSHLVASEWPLAPGINNDN